MRTDSCKRTKLQPGKLYSRYCINTSSVFFDRTARAIISETHFVLTFRNIFMQNCNNKKGKTKFLSFLIKIWSGIKKYFCRKCVQLWSGGQKLTKKHKETCSTCIKRFRTTIFLIVPEITFEICFVEWGSTSNSKIYFWPVSLWLRLCESS